MSRRIWLVLALNGILMVGIAHRYTTLRDAWRSHNMALRAWEVLERDQLDRGTEIFGPGFSTNPAPQGGPPRGGPQGRPPTNTPGP